MKELVRIQKELKAPKDKTNNFGGYRYRSAESVLEAVKPLLNGCLLLLTDEVVNIGSHNYIKSTSTLIEPDGTAYSTTASAREPETRKGMDDSQITGASSSYARKYALNGLFAIDDNQDADCSVTDSKKPVLTREMKAKWANAVQALINGKKIEDIESVYTLTAETKKQLADDMLA